MSVNYHAIKLKEELDKLNVYYDEATIKISSEFRRMRDFDWNKYVSDRQLAELVPIRGGKHRLIVTARDGKEVEFGTTTVVVEEPANYGWAIIPFVEYVKLERRNDNPIAIDQFQTVLLLMITDEDEMKDLIVNFHNQFKKVIHVKAKKKSGCLGVMTMILLVITIFGSIGMVAG